ncbi:uncharacterized protein OCT59_005605 [Rhizophagus irregularis]|uniref:uncharacterized protein n=1 Tax=Rhizophagus irregularis TaxID=588596 RepID=UPI00331F591C|nr:hypothetical protein OCT59_005605 [Rhizophagus irregularis]
MTTKRKLPNKSSDDNQEMEVEGGSKRKQITKKRRDIDIEKANQLMKKSKSSNKEAAESADKEVIVVNEKKSNDDDDDDDDDNDDDDESKTEDHKKPEVFQSKSNLEIVAWLIDHPEILRLALEMNNTDVAISSSSKITDDKIRLWDESVKCLFLRARSPRGEELIDYVDEEFVQKILSRQLVAVNISELTRNGGFNTLVDFVRETFKVSWNRKNLSAVKELDNMTKKLTIPSRSGNKIVDSLSL